MTRLRYFWLRLTGWITWKLLWVALVRLIIAGLVIAFVAGIIAAAYFASVFPEWTGFGPPSLDAQGHELPHAKTLWDWLGLLLVPLVLAVGGYLLTRAENDRARKLQERREQEAAVQAYLDQMTELLLHEKLRTSQPDDEVRSAARARTLTVLRILDVVRKATVLQFLYEANLIGRIKYKEGTVSGRIDAIVSLDGADLVGAHLVGARLVGAHLVGAHLVGANLERANLEWARLEWANLERAYLGRAYLHEADLTNCKVTREQLAQAKSLEGAKLPFDMAPPPAPDVEVTTPKDQATDLRGADPQGATMPDGSKHD